MTAQELKYDFLLKKDRIQSLSTSNFNDAEIDWFLNEAQLVFLKTRLGLNNSKGASYEMVQKRIDDLSELHIKFPVQPTLPVINHQSVYELPLNTLKFPYFSFLRGTVFVKDDKCSTEVSLKFVQSDDESEILKDPFNNASTEFIPYNFGKATTEGSSIYMYQGILDIINKNFIVADFDSRAATKYSQILNGNFSDLKEMTIEGKNGREKMKVDHLILACALVNGATAIYSHDVSLKKFATGLIDVRPLPIRPVQSELFPNIK